MVIACVSFGLWQKWWLASSGIIAAIVAATGVTLSAVTAPSVGESAPGTRTEDAGHA
jgi:hypothetical protein